MIECFNLEGKFVCSYIGTIGMSCGLDVVLRTAELLKKNKRDEIIFLLVGDGALKKRLEKEAGEKKLDNIIFAGRQDKKLISAFLSISDVCLVHLKKADTFKTVLPSKIFEAAAMQKPIILGVEGNAAELIRKANGGTCIEPENAEQLFSAVCRLADDSELRQVCGRAGQQYIIEHHNRNRLADEYLDVIARVCNNGSFVETACLEGK